MLLLPFALFLFQVPPTPVDLTSCQLYWRVSYSGACKTRKDLDDVLALHKRWLDSDLKDGKRADFKGAILSNDDLKKADLRGADLEGAILSGADLSGASLGPATQKASMANSSPGAWVLPPPSFLSIQMVDANGVGSGGFDSRTNLQHAIAANCDLRGVDLSNSLAQFVSLSGSNLSDANLAGANLSHAFLTGTILDHANVAHADFSGATLEPSSTLGLNGLGAAQHLDTVTFDSDPSGLNQLVKILRDQGYRDQERKLVYALNHREAAMGSFTERWFKYIAFDLTCQYGMNPGRCLRLIFVVWAIFSILFYFALHRRGWMLLRVTRRLGYKEKTRQTILWAKPSNRPGRWYMRYFSRLRFEWRMIRVALFFSLINGFSIGYKEFSVGQWLLLLPRKQFEIKTSGWARTFAGIESLSVFYLFALWVLTYFGRPFE